MPSDDRIARALAALAAPLASYRAMLRATLEQVERELAEGGSAAEGRTERARVELGSFAAGRIDAARFAELFPGGAGPSPAARQGLERAASTLRELAERGDERFAVTVPAGDSARRWVANALADVGRAFGAALVAEYARRGIYDAREHDELLRAFPFARWNRAERRAAPPLVIVLEGADLRAGMLAEFMDVGLRFVLVVSGPATPAPLARLVTPHVLVAQTDDAALVERVARVEGPAVVALVPEGAARFVHDPGAGTEPWQRLAVSFVPAAAPARPVGGVSAWQQAEELALLGALARKPVPAVEQGAGAAAPRPVVSADPVDRLAAWLLAQADLGGQA